MNNLQLQIENVIVREIEKEPEFESFPLSITWQDGFRKGYTAALQEKNEKERILSDFSKILHKIKVALDHTESSVGWWEGLFNAYEELEAIAEQSLVGGDRS
jgi:hypothetical protein